MRAYAVLSVIWLVCFVQGHPHPSCTLRSDNWLWCTDSNLDFPNTFDVNRIDNRVKNLVLYCPNAHTKIYCNVIRKNFQPFPRGDSLKLLWMNGFRADNERRIPLNKVLKHVRAHIEHLSVQHSMIGYLDAEYFLDFSSLEILNLKHNDIYDIAVDTFQSLQMDQVTVINHDQESWQTRLSNIELDGNALQQLDWSIFYPVQSSLQSINLSEQKPKLQRLHMSGVDFMVRLRSVYIRETNLTTIPSKILRSINTGLSTYLYFDNNYLMCTKADCSCCEMEPFMRWAANVTQTNPLLMVCVTCGEETHTSFSLGNIWRLYETCPKCSEAEVININCRASIVSISESNLDTTDATVAVFTSDGTLRCSMVLHDFYHNLLELTNTTAPSTTGDAADAIEFSCRDNIATVRGPDPNIRNPKKIMVQADISPLCHSVFTRFLVFAEETRLHDSDQTTPALPSTQPVVSIDQWIDRFLVCSLGDNPDFVATCRTGNVTFSHSDLQAVKSSVIRIDSDITTPCRAFVVKIHEYLLSTAYAQVSTADSSLDAVLAVCQKGQIVISDGSPRHSAKKNLTFYSAPNKLCQKLYRGFLTYLYGFSQPRKETPNTAFPHDLLPNS
ncbi:uncharacterized protein LOC129585321 [Paramacrobiotus metropolitanus]|uniref:uncharacterized protein LOC129585321 n=1 Tax=Paramacrobiotus metropolitanus TaxID=2943436 RepID=UPI00244625A7|nr:uncharacterized protein LOC129585321 [Paramacrobiotus metropolitanus]